MFLAQASASGTGAIASMLIPLVIFFDYETSEERTAESQFYVIFYGSRRQRGNN